MGEKSTQYLTRKQAKRKIKDRMHDMADDELERLCERVCGDMSYCIRSEEDVARLTCGDTSTSDGERCGRGLPCPVHWRD